MTKKHDTTEAQSSTLQSEDTSSALQDPAKETDSSVKHVEEADFSEEQLEEKRAKRLFQLRDRFLRRKASGERKKRRRYRPNPPTDFRKELTTIPNILTYIRMLMLPLILLVLDRENRWSSFLAGCAFSFACFTDFFDGYFARKFNQITVLGKLLDPLADKLIVSATLIVMIPMGRVPSWLVIVLIAREFAITGLRGIAASEGLVIASAPLAKYKTAFQMVAIFCLLIHYPYVVDYFGVFNLYVSFHRMGIVFLYISLFFSITSGLDYFWKFGKAINIRYEDALRSSRDPQG